MYIYICMRIYIYTYVCVYIYTYVCVYIYIHMYSKASPSNPNPKKDLGCAYGGWGAGLFGACFWSPYLGVSKYQGPHRDPQMVRLLLQGPPQKGPTICGNSRLGAYRPTGEGS